jgi:hypothetical protein
MSFLHLSGCPAMHVMTAMTLYLGCAEQTWLQQATQQLDTGRPGSQRSSVPGNVGSESHCTQLRHDNVLPITHNLQAV